MFVRVCVCKWCRSVREIPSWLHEGCRHQLTVCESDHSQSWATCGNVQQCPEIERSGGQPGEGLSFWRGFPFEGPATS